MDFRNNKRVNIGLFLTGLLLGSLLLLLNHAGAAFITTPPVTTGTNLQISAIAISTSTAASTLQVNASSTFAAFFLNQSTDLNAGPIFDIRSNNLSRLFISNGGLVGIGTTSPAQLLSVHGGALISGNLSVAGLTATGTTKVASTTNQGTLLTGDLIATGTTKFNNVVYTWPATDGTANNTLSTNGAGTLSWSATVSAWNECASTTLTSAANTMTVSSIPARVVMRVYINILDVDGNNGASVRFNSDGAANYGVLRSDNNAAITASSSQTAVNLTLRSQGGITATMDIFNNPTQNKTMFFTANDWEGVAPSVGSYVTYDGRAVWANTTAAINSITVQASTGGLISAGSQLITYCSQI